MKDKIDYKKQGKKNRAAGKLFETKVRKKLEADGWIVDKWTNNVELSTLEEASAIHLGNNKWIKRLEPTKIKLVPCRPKFNPFTKAMMMNSGGFPDFIAFKHNRTTYRLLDNPTQQEIENFAMRIKEVSGSENIIVGERVEVYPEYEIIGVESKSNGTLKLEEKQKCEWYLEQKIFSKILIAKKGEKRGEIIFTEFKNGGEEE